MKKYIPYAISLLVIFAGAYLILYPGINPLTLLKTKLVPPKLEDTEPVQMKAITDLNKIDLNNLILK